MVKLLTSNQIMPVQFGYTPPENKNEKRGGNSLMVKRMLAMHKMRVQFSLVSPLFI